MKVVIYIRTLLAMFCCLLAVAMSAFAEGAWVLWSQPFEFNWMI